MRSRPLTTNDNPHSEAWFETFRYAPDFPERLGSIGDASEIVAGFLDWYNHEHRHTGIGLDTDADAHYCLASARPLKGRKR